jgi:hypothetical protein
MEVRMPLKYSGAVASSREKYEKSPAAPPRGEQRNSGRPGKAAGERGEARSESMMS